VSFASFLARERTRHPSQEAMCAAINTRAARRVVQTRLSAWLAGSRPSPSRMRDVAEALGHDWAQVAPEILAPEHWPAWDPPADPTRIPEHLRARFTVGPDTDPRMVRVAWEAAAAAFAAVLDTMC
jgi:hypothetical protein